MPCSDQPPDRPYCDELALNRRINKLAQMLCWLCGKVEIATPDLIEENPSLSEWWKEHKAHDARRKLAKEELLKMAMEARAQETGTITMSYTVTGATKPN